MRRVRHRDGADAAHCAAPGPAHGAALIAPYASPYGATGNAAR